MATYQKAFRLPDDVIDVLREHSNATAYVIAAVREKAKRDKRAAEEATLERLGEHPEDNDIEYFQRAQAEAILNGD